MGLLTEMRAARELRTAQHLARKGRWPQAVEIFRRILAAQPRHARALLHMAHALVPMGEREAAVDAANRAIELKPNDPSFLILAGEVQLDAGRAEAAADLFDRALKASPQNDLARAYLLLANWRKTGELIWAEQLRDAGLPDSTAFMLRLLMTVENTLRPAPPPLPSPVAIPCTLPFCARRFRDLITPGEAA